MKILLVEDNVSLCRNIASVLQNEGYTVVTCSNGNEAEFQMLNNSSDLILLDRMLPGKDGITLTREARAAGITVPILLLTALDTLGDKVTGLDAGADDYLTKPFAMGEFLARIRSMTRRANAFTPAVLSAGGVTLNVEEQELSAESAIRLGSKETKLMKYFMMNAGKALTQEEILRYVWSDEPDVPADIVWMYISFLKEKLAAVRGKAVIEGEKEGPFVLRAMGD